MRSAADFAAAEVMLRYNEGVRKSVYKDSLGIPTIGVGFNLQRKDADEKLAKVGAYPKSALIDGKILTSTQVDMLLRNEIDDCVADLRTLFSNFDDMPLEAQLVLVDLRFNVGPSRLRMFNSTLKAFRESKYHKAATFLRATLWAKQVGPRSARAIQLLLRCKNGSAHEP